ncbi:lipase LipV [Actinomadura kijaniata]|uniref:Lipase n=1 Tax=Actinomadura namibiensis TaxID=182080 RepID=A0A7W3LR93_ACTNM|nr:alpha/beta hydrolase [Actinomadura namibiensis]MBA8952792.1 lipase [Actinomadura namibiensis]
MTGLHVNFHGAGRPLVALHGIGGHGARWRRLAERHLDGFRVLAPDLRGHGRSPHDAPWDVDTHVADLLAALPEERFDLVGHSYGGMIAVHLARAAPERVRRLVLLDPGIGLDPAHARRSAGRYLRDLSFADPAEARAERARGWAEAAPEAVDAEVADHLEQGADGRWRWRYERAAVVTAFSEMARPAATPPREVPTLLVVATRAGVVRPAYVTACRAAVADFAAAELDAGHMLYLDRPEETATLIRDWLTP